MNVTTISMITSHIVTVVTALTPASLPSNNASFVENPTPNAPLRNWARLNAKAKVMRLFEVATVGDRAPSGDVNNWAARLVDQLIRVTVAYPTEHKDFGISTRRGLEDAIAADAAQIQGALVGPGGLAAAGHLSLRREPGVKEPDRSNVVVWFQDLDLRARFYEAR